jgi:Ca2+-binding EF-hand superfamily protein
MQVDVGAQTLKNLVKMFDTNGDNAIDLNEFEKQMSKYMDRG